MLTKIKLDNKMEEFDPITGEPIMGMPDTGMEDMQQMQMAQPPLMQQSEPRTFDPSRINPKAFSSMNTIKTLFNPTMPGSSIGVTGMGLGNSFGFGQPVIPRRNPNMPRLGMFGSGKGQAVGSTVGLSNFLANKNINR